MVTLKSASAAADTETFTVAELLFPLVSFVVVPTVTVSVISVPPAVPAITLKVAVIVPVEPGSTLGLVHDTGPAGAQVHVPPPVVTAQTETKVVLAGVASVSVPAEHVLGPLLVTTCV